MSGLRLERRAFLRTAGIVTLAALGREAHADAQDGFRLDYILGSCMYGTMALAEILPEVPKTGATHIDVWPAPHGNQREQVADMGIDAFAGTLELHGVQLGILTRYDLGPFGLGPEMAVARQLGCSLIVCGGKGPVGLEGDALKEAVRDFAEQMKPHIAVAEEHDVTIGIENHGKNLIDSADSMRWLVEFVSSPRLGIALAPYHLPQEPALIAGLIEDLGPRLAHFYAWEHGVGCHEKRPKEEELLQMPGRGTLDFGPILASLRRIGYSGWTEVFMHPVPRGIPVLPTAREVTEEINRARAYLEGCLAA